MKLSVTLTLGLCLIDVCIGGHGGGYGRKRRVRGTTSLIDAETDTEAGAAEGEGTPFWKHAQELETENERLKAEVEQLRQKLAGESKTGGGSSGSGGSTGDWHSRIAASSSSTGDSAGSAHGGNVWELAQAEWQPKIVPPADKTFSSPTYSGHQCAGQVFMDMEWVDSSCYFRNLCYDVKNNEYLYYRDKSEPKNDFPKDLEFFSYLRRQHGHGRGYMQQSMGVSLLGMNTQSGFDKTEMAPPGSQAFKWEPKIVDGPIPDDAVIDTSAAVFILHYQYVGHNIGHILFDDMYAWFRLMRMFNLLDHNVQPLSYFPEPELEDKWIKLFNDERIIIMPFQIKEQCFGFERLLQTTPIPENCQDAFKKAMKESKSEADRQRRGMKASLSEACTKVTLTDSINTNNKHLEHSTYDTLVLWWYRVQMTKLCRKLSHKFAPAMGSKPILKFPPDNVIKDAYKAPAGADLVCFPRLLAGSGMLTEHCSDASAHGWVSGQKVKLQFKNDNLICGAGTGPELFQFRNWMITNLKLANVPRPCEGKKEKLQLLIGLRSRKGRIEGAVDTRTNAASEAHWKKAGEEFEKLGIKVKAVVLAEMTLKEQIEVYMESFAAIQGSGGASNTGIFLPRGGTMILLAPRDGKNDYLLWGHMAHITTDWFELNEFESLFDIKQVKQLVKNAIRTYHMFNDCYDAATDDPPEHIGDLLESLELPA